MMIDFDAIRQHIDLFLIMISILSCIIYQGHNILYKLKYLIEKLAELTAKMTELSDFKNSTNERIARIESALESSHEQIKSTQNQMSRYFEKMIAGRK